MGRWGRKDVNAKLNEVTFTVENTKGITMKMFKCTNE